MKRLLNVLLGLIFVSCATPKVSGTPALMNTKIFSTNTPLPLTPTPVSTKITTTNTSPPPSIITPSIIQTIIFTPEPPCDPFAVDFCITEGHFILQRPIQPPRNDLVDPTYRYASTADGTREPHHGVEFQNPSGTPVHAAAYGTVIFAGPDEAAIYAPWGNFYGNLVVLEHEDEVFTLYAHLSKIDVTAGQNVFAGEEIGEVGRTGGAIGSHLHFEVRRRDPQDYFATQNPELWLIPAKDENGNFFGVLMLIVMDEDGNLVKSAKFTIGYYADPSQPPTRVYYATPYSSDMLTGDESAALGDLSAGQYRIVVERNGQIYERWVEVQSGRLTQVAFVVK